MINRHISGIHTYESLIFGEIRLSEYEIKFLKELTGKDEVDAVEHFGVVCIEHFKEPQEVLANFDIQPFQADFEESSVEFTVEKALEAAKQQVTELPPALKTDDLKAEAELYLTDKAKKALEKKIYSLNIFTDGKLSHQCLYLGKKTTLDKVTDGIKDVAERINALAEAGEIYSCLSHFIKVDFFQHDPFKPQQCAVLCYVHVSREKYEELFNQHKGLKEGEVPE